MVGRMLGGPSIRPSSFEVLRDELDQRRNRLVLGLAPVAALVALVLAGLALRNQSSVLQNGRFGLWMFWRP